MDEELKHLEAELRRMRPAAVPPALMHRIERALAAPAPRAPAVAVPWIWALVVPAAAALAVWLAPAGDRFPPGGGPAGQSALAASAAELRPVKVENLLVAAQDEGLVTLEDGTPARRARLKFVDSVTWRDPRTNASLTWTVPREEVRVTPVVFQ